MILAIEYGEPTRTYSQTASKSYQGSESRLTVTLGPGRCEINIVYADPVVKCSRLDLPEPACTFLAHR